MVLRSGEIVDLLFVVYWEKIVDRRYVGYLSDRRSGEIFHFSQIWYVGYGSYRLGILDSVSIFGYLEIQQL